MSQRHPVKLPDMDFTSRLPAPADLFWLQLGEILDGVLVRPAAEVHPDITSARIGIEFPWESGLVRLRESSAPVDKAGIGKKAIVLAVDQDSQSLVLNCPVGPEPVIPVDLFDPLALGKDFVAEPDKMRDRRISRVKEGSSHHGI